MASQVSGNGLKVEAKGDQSRNDPETYFVSDEKDNDEVQSEW